MAGSENAAGRITAHSTQVPDNALKSNAIQNPPPTAFAILFLVTLILFFYIPTATAIGRIFVKTEGGKKSFRPLLYKGAVSEAITALIFFSLFFSALLGLVYEFIFVDSHIALYKYYIEALVEVPPVAYLACVVLGGIAFFIRSNLRLMYGLAELGIGVWLTYRARYITGSDVLEFLAGIYVIVRAMDNIEKGLRTDKTKFLLKLWYSIFDQKEYDKLIKEEKGAADKAVLSVASAASAPLSGPVQ